VKEEAMEVKADAMRVIEYGMLVIADAMRVKED
jgi:hypothetical protein